MPPVIPGFGPFSRASMTRCVAVACFIAATFAAASSSRADTATQPQSTTTTTPSTGAAAPDLSTPKKAGLSFANALMADDMDTVHKTATGSDSDFNLIKSLGGVIQAMKRYETAAVKKFGEEGKLSKNENKDIAAEVEATEEKIEGDSATLINKANPNDKHPLTLKKDGAIWKVDLSPLGKDPDAAKLIPMSKAMVTALDGTTKDVDAGKYKTAQEAKDAMGAALFAVIIGTQTPATAPASK